MARSAPPWRATMELTMMNPKTQRSVIIVLVVLVAIGMVLTAVGPIGGGF